ncbi:MAG: amidohydrolase family protein [Deltaproteobacteria bacterium]
MKITRKIFDAHTHIGELAAYKFYDLKEPVKPTVIEYPTGREYTEQHMDEYRIDRALVISNYGVPDSAQPFSLNPLVLDTVHKADRIVGALWVSGMPKDKERTEETLKHVKEKGIVALKTTCLLGGTYKPSDWDEPSRALWDSIMKAAEENNLVLHIHTSPGGGSDISNAIELVKEYGKKVKIHLVHMGGFVSGHIKLVPKFIELIQDGYKVYTDTTWAVGFGSRWLLHEVQRTGVGWDNVVFGSDTPWSDFPSEYWKIEGAKISEELKNNIFWENAQKLYSK